jgi:hypothetical protein
VTPKNHRVPNDLARYGYGHLIIIHAQQTTYPAYHHRNIESGTLLYAVLPLDTVKNSPRAFDYSNGVSSPIFCVFFF